MRAMAPSPDRLRPHLKTHKLPQIVARLAELGDASGEAEVLRLRGFAALFRHEYELDFSVYKEATVLRRISRACAVLARGTYVFALPGSNGAVKDGWDQILAEQLDSRNRPCNFVELMPRLREV